jgi:hypothetical protein
MEDPILRCKTNMSDKGHQSRKGSSRTFKTAEWHPQINKGLAKIQACQALQTRYLSSKNLMPKLRIQLLRPVRPLFRLPRSFQLEQ